MQTEIFVEGVIGDDWFTDNPVTLKNVRSQIQDDTDEIVLHINSPGGYVTEAWAIHDHLRMMDVKKTAVINGLCASAATIIAAACDQVHMSQNSDFMIHLPWTIAMGNSEDFEEIVDMLKTEEHKIARLYADYTGRNIRTMRNLMAEEKFWDADRAKAEGFIDKVITTNRKKNKETSNLVAIATLPQMSKEMKVAACITHPNRNQININMANDKEKGLKAKLLAILNGKDTEASVQEPQIKDLYISLAAGGDMEILTDNLEPSVGDKVRMDNKVVEDGDYTTTKGDILTVKNETITKIDVYNAQAKITSLEQRFETLQNALNEEKQANENLKTQFEDGQKVNDELKKANADLSAKLDQVKDLLSKVSSEDNIEGMPPDSQAEFNSGDAKDLEGRDIDKGLAAYEARVKQRKAKA